MDYKEKYEEALERAKTLQNTCDSQAVVGWCEYLFPELKENEDERIRKALIEETKLCEDADLFEAVTNKQLIAWLEKQDGPKEYTFKSLPRLLDMIEPTRKAKAYCQKLIDTLVKEGYATDAKIVENCLKQMNGEVVPMATMDEKQGEKNAAISWHDASEEPEEMKELFCEWESDDATWHEVGFYHTDTKTFWDGERQIEGVTRWTYIDELIDDVVSTDPIYDYSHANIQKKDYAEPVLLKDIPEKDKHFPIAFEVIEEAIKNIDVDAMVKEKEKHLKEAMLPLGYYEIYVMNLVKAYRQGILDTLEKLKGGNP